MTTDEFIEQSNYYDSGYENQNMGPMGFPDLKIVNGNIDTKGKKILSLGGGNAADLWYLANTNEIHLIEGSEVAIEEATKHNIKGIIEDVTKPLPFENNIFDIVVLKDILEHVYSPITVLKEAKRVLKDDGEIIVSLPNHFYLPFRLKLLFGQNLIWKSLLHNHKSSFEEWNYMHIRFFTWKGTKKLLASENLKITKTYWDFGTLAHYSDPMMYLNAFKMSGKTIQTKRQFIMYKVLLPTYKVFNIIFPKVLRAKIVSLAPGLLCAGFYLKVTKDKH